MREKKEEFGTLMQSKDRERERDRKEASGYCAISNELVLYKKEKQIQGKVKMKSCMRLKSSS